MLLKAILHVLNNRCPACFKPVGADAVRFGLRLYCSREHRDKHAKRGGANPRGLDRTESRT